MHIIIEHFLDVLVGDAWQQEVVERHHLILRYCLNIAYILGHTFGTLQVSITGLVCVA
jgi:hypothetical protein